MYANISSFHLKKHLRQLNLYYEYNEVGYYTQDVYKIIYKTFDPNITSSHSPYV